MSWVNGLREQGCEVFLASARTDGSDGNIPIGNPRLSPRLRMISGIKGLKQKISEIKPDIVIAYRVTSYAYVAARTGFHPLVISAQNDQIIFETKRTFFRRKFLERCARYAIRKADLIHSWGSNITEGLLRFGADEKKVFTFHRGLNMAAFKENSRTKEFDPEKPVFITTRSLAPEYLFDKLLDAFKILVGKIPGARLEIIGTGSEESNLKKQAEDLALTENIAFRGKLTEKEVYQALSLADIYISIIETDGVSSSVIEAVAASLLPIVAEMPASDNVLVNNKNALLFTNGTPEKLAELMLKAVNSFENMMPALRENSQNIIGKYDRHKNQKLFLEKYKNLISYYSEK